MQISGANSEHKHSEIERFSTLKRMNNYSIAQSSKLKRLSLSVVNKFSDLH